jgi:hypothetical protein
MVLVTVLAWRIAKSIVKTVRVGDGAWNVPPTSGGVRE